jgi:histidine triad (HIT) family protein
MPAANCIFCKIASGTIPARKVLESADCLAFLDVAPLAPGHCLLIPKTHYGSLAELPADQAGALLGRLPALGGAVLRATGAEGFNVLLNSGKAAGQEVMHVHIHIIPRKTGDGLGYRWQPRPLDEAAADRLRQEIEAALAAG